jgi:predicted nucleic acid-binding protein
VTFSFGAVPLVLDASVAFEFLDGDPQWVQAFDEWASEDRMLLTPSHFLAEVANGHLRGRRAPAADVHLRLERLTATGIETADRGINGLLEAVDLADRHNLTVYDALYLQLALDVEGELATLDSDLAAAARAEDVALVA